MTGLAPDHPGEVMKQNFMPLDLSASGPARAIGASPARINAIIRGRRDMTADMALLMDRYFNTNARNWMNLRDRHEHGLAERARTGYLGVINPMK